MRLKKILASASALAIATSAFAVVPVQAADKAQATLSFEGYETKGASTFAKIKVSATVPETLKAYEMIAADWENTFEDTYTGTAIQTFAIDIPNVEGLTYVASLSTVHTTNFVSITNNTSAGMVSVAYANTGAYDTYYAGDLGDLATLYYRITGDVDGTYNVNIKDTSITTSIAKWADGTTSSTPSIVNYTKTEGWDIVNAVVQPAVATTYAVTLGEGATTDYTGDLTAVPENTEITVTATEKSGYTATLKKDGVAVTSPYTFAVTANTTFAVDYTPIVSTYTVTATSDVEVTGADISAPVAEGTKLNVAAKAKDGYTAKLLANGAEVAEGEYTVTGNVEFAVAYAPKYEYTLDDKGRCMKDSIKGIYYSLSVKNVADKLAIKVSDKTFEATGVPTVEGAALAQMTYAIFQVPEEIYNNVPAITAVTSGETVYSVAE